MGSRGRERVARCRPLIDPVRMTFLRIPLLAAVLALAACTSSSASPNCYPACRAGFVCAGGACVPECNPPCASGQTCVGSGATAVCIGYDASTPDVPAIVDAPVTDVPVATDTGPSGDAVAMDAANDASEDTALDGGVTDGSSLDASGLDATGADASTLDAMDASADAPPPCGHAGEPCCYTSFCNAGLSCTSGSCVPITRAAGECSAPSDCTGGQVCAGPSTCTDHGCFQCVAATGTTAYGGACTVGTDCASGVCAAGHCSMACVPGAAGNAACAAHTPGQLCGQVLYRTGTAPAITTVALGVCRTGCQRLADCTVPGENCHPLLNYATNTMDFVCGTSTGATAGSPCMSGSECQSFLCVGGVLDGGGACTAPCVTNTDCPAAAPRCVGISWLRPDGTGQSGMACLP
jgi:hypothetical protein